MKFTTNTLAAVSILAGASVSSAQRALHRHVVSGKQQRLGLRALNEELQADESMSMSLPVADEIDQNFGTDTGGGKSGKVPKVNVPTSPFSPNICAGQSGRFLEQAGLVPAEITCLEARDGNGPLGRVAPQTGGVSAEELYYTYHMLSYESSNIFNSLSSYRRTSVVIRRLRGVLLSKERWT